MNVCKNDKSVETKEEGIHDQEILQKKSKQRYESKLCTVHVKGDEILAPKKKQTQKKQKIQESKQEKKYKCKKCARSYAQKRSLSSHQKYECDVIPQFQCQFCSKRFKRRNAIRSHVDFVHLKKNLQTKNIRYFCDKCSRSYIWPNDLTRHKRLQHGAVKPKFFCDYCSYTTKQKVDLSHHITLRHLK
ncbi:zinc finger protein 85-like [Belonocnema kinseyi]|uniref:zinc finger protein 85-like n=1 Tax=Belonocnema kinseyi TaxID=2817044 RepID=UPI00143DD678|nr:zinc finger protein 85-like [Belonocnema kinseyi]